MTKRNSGVYAVAVYLSAMLVFAFLCPAAEKVQIAKDGKALLPVVISDTASENIKKVADELAGYLKQITGASFEVKVGDGNSGIVLGTIQQFPDSKVAPDLVIRNTFDGKEAYAIRTDDKRLLLIGATDLGVSHAAFRFLESIGCRWFFPAKEWEVIPSIRDLSVSINESDRPALLSRRIWYGYGFFDRDKTRSIEEYNAWARHNRMGCSLQIYCGHAWQSIIADNRKIFDEHPEYLALTGGKRQGEQLCVSNPEVRKIATEWALNYFKKHPEADMVSMECSDGGGQCECENCKKLGSISDRVFGLANEVARAVAKSYPGKMVGLYAYNEHSEPPSFKLEPNVCVQLTAGFIRGRYSFNELMDLWPQYCRNMGYYEYLSVYLWDWDMVPGGRGANISYLQKQIPLYVKNNGTTLDCESGNNWGPHGRGYYIANKLMWNPKARVDDLLDDFYKKAFGPAANAMKRYYERLDPGNLPIKSENLIGEAFQDLQEASILAKNRPDVQARLDQIKQYMHYVRLWWDYNHTRDSATKKDLMLNVLTWVYRTRYTYMNHWEAMRQHLTRQAAQQFNEPSWAFNDPTPNKPWAIETPVTHEETEKLFQADLARFPVQTVQEVAFSSDLVPAGFRTANPAETQQRYQGAVTYALYSVNGEPIECGIVTGTIAWYRDRKKAEYTVTDGSGKIIAQERLALDGQLHPVKVSVPRAGLYLIAIDDSWAGMAFSAKPGVPCVLVQKKGVPLMHQGHMQQLYFYVPKGTKQLQYFINNSTPHNLYGPDGKLIKEVTGDDVYVTIPVPEGLDGKVWSARFLALGQMWFFNIPSYLAASPDALLVPREIAARDGLLP